MSSKRTLTDSSQNPKGPYPMAQKDDRVFMWERCYACGHRLRFPASACPQCPEVFDGRDDPKEWPEFCKCERCKEARG